MALFGKDYTTDFEKLKREIRNVNDGTNTNFDKVFVAINEIQTKQESIETSIEALIAETKILKSIIYKSVEPVEMVEVEVPDPTSNMIREIPKSVQTNYKTVYMVDYEFYQKTKPGRPLFDIFDVLKLAKLIGDIENYPTISMLHRAILPDYSRNGFLRMVYNYQKGFFKPYIENYAQNLTFNRDNFELLVNDTPTGLDVNQVIEIASIVVNAADFDKCVEGLAQSYPNVKPIFVKIVAYNYDNPKLAELIPILEKEVVYENNPQKRREKAL